MHNIATATYITTLTNLNYNYTGKISVEKKMHGIVAAFELYTQTCTDLSPQDSSPQEKMLVPVKLG